MGKKLIELKKMRGFLFEEHKIPLISTVLIADSENKARLIELLASKDITHASITQIHTVDNEWEAIESLHELFFYEIDQGKVLHHISPLRQVLLPDPEPRYIESQRLMFKQLPHLINMESWVHYCRIYSELLQKTRSQFISDAAEEYTLEGNMKDFEHEVHSSLLKDAREKLIKAFDLLQQTQGYQEALERNKDIVRARLELLQSIRAHYDSLGKIIGSIHSIKSMHPELIEVERIGSLLRALLENQVDETSTVSWAKEQMLIQILNDHFSITSLIIGQDLGERTKITMALRAAIKHLMQSEGEEKVTEMVLHFDEGKHPMISKLQNEVALVLESLPKISTKIERNETEMINPDILSILPPDYDLSRI